MYKLNSIPSSTLRLLVSGLLISGLFSTELSAAVIDGNHWIIKPGDSLYKIARTIYPNSTKQQTKLRKALITENPQAFRNGASNISVGDKLQLPAFAIETKQPVVPVIVKKTESKIEKPEPVSVNKTLDIVTADPEDVVGQVIINVGTLSAQNRGETRALKRRSAIYRGDTISTGRQGLTQIRLKDGALLSLRPQTDIRIAEYRYNGQEDGSEQSILELIKGGFRTITGAIGHKNKQNYKVRTNIATIGIRGTHYSLVLCQDSSCSSDSTANIDDGLYGEVADGSIIVENQTGIHTFNNDQFFKLTSSSVAPVRVLTPPSTILNKTKKSQANKTQKRGKNISGKSQARRTAVIYQPNQPNFSRTLRPLPRDQDLPSLPDANSTVTKAPNGSAALISFQQLDDTGLLDSVAVPVIVIPANNNQIILGENRTPVALREFSPDENGTIVQHDLIISTPLSTARPVPSSVGGNPAIGVNWGRWNIDFTLVENGQLVQTNRDLHYIYSENLTSPSQLSALGGTVGSASYSLKDGTLPTDNLGNIAATQANIDMVADFTNQQITTYRVLANVGGTTYNAETITNIPFQNLNESFDIQSISTGCLSTCVGEASVVFVGNAAGGAMTTYQIEDSSGIKGITGAALLEQIPAQEIIQ